LKFSFLLGEWIDHWLHSKSAHGIHSPFVFDFYNTVFKGKLHPSFEDEFRKIRLDLLSDYTPINHIDFGAGSRLKLSDNQTVASIAKRSTKSFYEASLIARLVDFMQPSNIVEIGTSFGSSSFLIHSVNPDIPLYTIEGSPQIADRAQSLFDKLNPNNIQLFIGQFDVVLPKLFDSISSLGSVIVDGNHRFEPTLKYFELALAHSNHETFFVFDDIRWSQEMLLAWKKIIDHPSVSLSIDLFSMGVVFLNPALSKQNIRISI
jgi:hypothetical protein